MARPQKEGLDYFPLDVDVDQDDKIALIEAQHGIMGFALVIKLLMKIYKHGYFYQWTEKEQLLFSKQVNVNINEVNVIINDCLKWGLFDEKMFKTHGILTSKGIQRRYLEAASRRNKVILLGEYLLIPSKEVNVYKNLVIEYINPDSEEVNDDINPQSKVKESKELVVVVDESFQSVIQAYESNIGIIPPIVSQKIDYWIDRFNEPHSIMIKAIETAALNNKRTFNYIEGILKSWEKEGYKTLAEIEAAEVEYNNRKGEKGAFNRGGHEQASGESQDRSNTIGKVGRFRPRQI